MNLFYLHEEPQVSATLHCDKHVVKMIIEYAQMLSTAHRMLDGDPYVSQTLGGRRRYKDGDLTLTEKISYTRLLISITHLLNGYVKTDNNTCMHIICLFHCVTSTLTDMVKHI